MVVESLQVLQRKILGYTQTVAREAAALIQSDPQEYGDYRDDSGLFIFKMAGEYRVVFRPPTNMDSSITVRIMNVEGQMGCLLDHRFVNLNPQPTGTFDIEKNQLDLLRAALDRIIYLGAPSELIPA